MRRGKRDPVSASQEKHLVSPGEYGAWLFDIDGVITDTASVHAAAWKSYEEAARMLGTLPEQAGVIEDAISGVQAGRTGGFGLVIGVARGDDPEVLRQNGADFVVRDLAELSLV